MQEHRCFYIDNIRAFLIFLVVLGHLLEQVFFPGSGALYRLIYTFHMPAFAFLSGLCFRKKPFSHLVKTLLYPYFLFQTLFLLFDAYEKHAPLEMQYTTPYWALWYLLALFFWRLMANSLNFSVPAAKFFVPCGLAVALLAGLDSSIGYYLSLSRCLVLFPFFLAGAWIQANGRAQFEAIIHHPGLRARMAVALAAASAAAGILLSCRWIPSAWLWHSFSYEKGDYSFPIRLLTLGLAAVFIVFLLFFAPNRPLPLLTVLGQRTMPVYLIHCFLLKYLSFHHTLAALPFPFLSSLALAAGIVFVFSSKPVVSVFQVLCQTPSLPRGFLSALTPVPEKK